MHHLARYLIRFYQLFISPLLGNHCRFSPSCSQYALETIEVYGVGVGIRLTIHSLLRCQPWHMGEFDPVPGKVIEDIVG